MHKFASRHILHSVFQYHMYVLREHLGAPLIHVFLIILVLKALLLVKLLVFIKLGK